MQAHKKMEMTKLNTMLESLDRGCFIHVLHQYMTEKRHASTCTTLSAIYSPLVSESPCLNDALGISLLRQLVMTYFLFKLTSKLVSTLSLIAFPHHSHLAAWCVRFRLCPKFSCLAFRGFWQFFVLCSTTIFHVCTENRSFFRIDSLALESKLQGHTRLPRQWLPTSIHSLARIPSRYKTLQDTRMLNSESHRDGADWSRYMRNHISLKDGADLTTSITEDFRYSPG
jgi:hypothetical protein